MGNDAHSHELLSVVAAIHHERVGETLNDGALGLSEPLDGIATGGAGLFVSLWWSHRNRDLIGRVHTVRCIQGYGSGHVNKMIHSETKERTYLNVIGQGDITDLDTLYKLASFLYNSMIQIPFALSDGIVRS